MFFHTAVSIAVVSESNPTGIGCHSFRLLQLQSAALALENALSKQRQADAHPTESTILLCKCARLCIDNPYISAQDVQ